MTKQSEIDRSFTLTLRISFRLIRNETAPRFFSPGVRVELNVLHDAEAFLNEKRAGATDIDLASLQHPDHPAPGTILTAVSPGIGDVETYPARGTNITKSSSRHPGSARR